LKPVKRKEIVKKTSAILDIPEEVIDEVITHFYHTLQKKMSAIDDVGIYVPNLGNFVLKKKRLDSKMINHENILKELGTDMSLVKYDILMKKKANLEKMKVMHEKLNEEEIRKQEYKYLRKENNG
jgi:hypothetical protein